jgi:hypothetical protein
MAREKDDSQSPVVVPPATEGASRPNLPRTPPGVWPPMSPAEVGRVVRKLQVTAQRLRDSERRVALLSPGGAAS